MVTNREIFGKTIRSAREDNDIGLRELARTVGINYSTLSRMERGERPPPDLDMVIKIADELNIEQSKLLRLAGVPGEVIASRETQRVENWIEGRVVDRAGELTEIDAGDWTLHVVERPETEKVLLGLRPKDITLFLTENGFSGTSARNRIKGKIVGFEPCGNYNLAKLDCGTFSLKVAITYTSMESMNLAVGKEVYATFKAAAPVVKSRG